MFKTEKKGEQMHNFLFSPGESEMNTMANTNVNTSFCLETSEE